MDEQFFRFVMVAAFIAGMLGIAAVTGELSSHSFSDPFEDLYPAIELSSVSELMDHMPLGEHVTVPGTVSHLAEDHVSSSGHTYQQFFISDGSSEVKVFCSTEPSRADIEMGDEVAVTGKFQKYYDTLEIYADCSSVSIKN